MAYISTKDNHNNLNSNHNSKPKTLKLTNTHVNFNLGSETGWVTCLASKTRHVCSLCSQNKRNMEAWGVKYIPSNFGYRCVILINNIVMTSRKLFEGHDISLDLSLQFA